MHKLLFFIFLSLSLFYSSSYAGSIVKKTNSNSILSIDLTNNKITFITNPRSANKWWKKVKDGIRSGRLFKYSIYISNNYAYLKVTNFGGKLLILKSFLKTKLKL